MQKLESAKVRKFVVVAGGIVLMMACAQPALSGGEWALSNAIVISDYFVSFYYPHGAALVAAGERMAAREPLREIVEELGRLPGVFGVLIYNGASGQSLLTSMNLAPSEAILDSLLADDDLFKTHKSPMTKKLLGGRCRFRQVEARGGKYDLMILPLSSETTPKRSAIALLLDRAWLLRQVPAKMDSLYRESSQLLFWSASPTNNQWEQSIGIIEGADTLWWAGPKIEIKYFQILWPFIDVKIVSRVEKP